MDNIIGTGGNDTILGVVDLNAAAGRTFNAGDNINGGAGIDTLKLTVSDVDGAQTVAVTSVEKIYVTNTDATGPNTDYVYNALLTTGAQELWNENSVSNVSFTNVQNAVTLGVIGGEAGDTTELVYANGKLGSASASQTIVVQNTGDDTLGYHTVKVTTGGTDVIKSLTIDATGANWIQFEEGTLASTDITTLTVTGTGSLDLTGTAAGELAGVKTADFSANSGGVTFAALAGAAQNFTVTGGSGNDVLDLGNLAAAKFTVNMGDGDDVVSIIGSTAGDFGADRVLKGGAGTDVLVANSADFASIAGGTAAQRASISEFEIIRFADGLAHNVNVSKISGVNHVQLDANTAGNSTLSGFTSGGTLEVRDAGHTATKTVTIDVTNATNAGTNDTFNIRFNADMDGAAADSVLKIDIAGVETLNVSTATRGDDPTANGKGYELQSGANTTQVKTINITGDVAFTFDAAKNAAATAIETIDGSTFAADLTVDLSAYAGSAGVVVKGGAGDDVLTGSDKGDNISGGAGDDVIRGGKGNDILTGGAGSDTFVFEATAANNGKDTITDFTAGNGGDVLHVDNFLGVVTVTAANLALTATSANVTLANDNVYVLTLNEAIAGKNYATTDFNSLIGNGSGQFNATVAANANGVIIVRGTDQAHVYFVDASAGTSTAIEAGEIGFVGVLQGSIGAFTVANFA